MHWTKPIFLSSPKPRYASMCKTVPSSLDILTSLFMHMDHVLRYFNIFLVKCYRCIIIMMKRSLLVLWFRSQIYSNCFLYCWWWLFWSFVLVQQTTIISCCQCEMMLCLYFFSTSKLLQGSIIPCSVMVFNDKYSESNLQKDILMLYVIALTAIIVAQTSHVL